MSRIFQQALRTIELPNPLQGCHFVAKQLFQTLNYRWETRSQGELKLGYWRIQYRKQKKSKAYPKRLVLIPGFGDSPLSWYGVLSLLSPVLRSEFDEVLLLDFPGFTGFLSRERAFPSFLLMQTMVYDALDALKPHTLLGHSLGGWLSTSYAIQCGEGQRPLSNRKNYSGPTRVLLVNPGGVYARDLFKQRVLEVFHGALNEGFSRLQPHLFHQEPRWFKYVSSALSDLFQREDIRELIHSVSPDQTLENSLHAIQSQVWLLWGECDTLIPSECITTWFQKFNPERKHDLKAVTLLNLGHSPQVEGPIATASVIGQILKNQVPSGLGKRWWQVSSESQTAF